MAHSETKKHKRQSRQARARLKAETVLDEGLAAVREGREPYINGEIEHLGVLKVLDPHEPESKTPRTKIINLRDDPVGQMFKRGQLGHGSSSKVTDDVRLKAAREYQRLFEIAEISGAKAIDFAKEKVDGGRFEMPDTDHRLRAQFRLNELRAKIGIIRIQPAIGHEVRILGTRLLAWVLGEKLCLRLVAERLGYDRRQLPLLGHFIGCLDVLAIEFGFADDPLNKRGPRRRRDQFDHDANLAYNPALHRAVRLAQTGQM